MAGTFVAKAIADGRLMDLPISSLMWDLMLNKKMNLFDLKRLDNGLFEVFSVLQVMANRKNEIDEMEIDPETKIRLLSSIKDPKGKSVEDFYLHFYNPADDSIELVKDGAEIRVTLENLQSYIDLVLHNTFHETVKL